MKYSDRTKRPVATAPDYARIPDELKAMRRWVLWRFDWSVKGGSWAKVPYRPNGQRASSTDESQWSSFESAVLALEQTKSSYDGIGFVFAAGDGLAGIDLDNCVTTEDGEFRLTPFAVRVVGRLDTYTEFSPSLTGLHLIGKAATVTAVKTAYEGNDFEMYGTGRYFTFTGRTWEDEPRALRDISAEATEISAYFAKVRDSKAPVQTAEHLGDLSIDARVGLALKKSHRARRLYDGDISEYGGDDSRADMALLNLLAPYSDGRADVLDKMFRSSSLFRPKWDDRRGDRTYGELSVDKCLDNPNRVYASVRSATFSNPDSYESRKVHRYSFDDVWEKAMEFRANGEARGVETGWAELDEFYRPVKRSLALVTGKPGSGKSTWLDVLAYNIAVLHGWKFTFASFETLPIERHILNLCQIHLKKPTFQFVDGAARDYEMESARVALKDMFRFILPPDDQMDINSLLAFVDDDIRDHGISGFVLDPFTEVDIATELYAKRSETHAIKDVLISVQNFTRRREIATWIIAHPTKPNKETFVDGRPTLSAVSGSQNFYNKIDFGIVVDRDKSDTTTVYVDKVRNDINGYVGKVAFSFDKYSKLYTPYKPPAADEDGGFF